MFIQWTEAMRDCEAESAKVNEVGPSLWLSAGRHLARCDVGRGGIPRRVQRFMGWRKRSVLRTAEATRNVRAQYYKGRRSRQDRATEMGRPPSLRRIHPNLQGLQKKPGKDLVRVLAWLLASRGY